MKNLIIVGLEENGESEYTASVINNFLTDNLHHTDIKIYKARWLEKFQKKTGPILVAFNSQSDRKAVLTHRTQLAGSNIYIIYNFDLTREQLKEQPKLKETRKQLIKLPDFIKVTIYQNKLHIDRQPISSDTLRTAGIQQ